MGLEAIGCPDGGPVVLSTHPDTSTATWRPSHFLHAAPSGGIFLSWSVFPRSIPPGDPRPAVACLRVFATVSATETCRYPPRTDAVESRGPAHCLHSAPVGESPGPSRPVNVTQHPTTLTVLICVRLNTAYFVDTIYADVTLSDWWRFVLFLIEYIYLGVSFSAKVLFLGRKTISTRTRVSQPNKRATGFATTVGHRRPGRQVTTI